MDSNHSRSPCNQDDIQDIIIKAQRAYKKIDLGKLDYQITSGDEPTARSGSGNREPSNHDSNYSLKNLIIRSKTRQQCPTPVRSTSRSNQNQNKDLGEVIDGGSPISKGKRPNLMANSDELSNSHFIESNVEATAEKLKTVDSHNDSNMYRQALLIVQNE